MKKFLITSVCLMSLCFSNVINASNATDKKGGISREHLFQSRESEQARKNIYLNWKNMDEYSKNIRRNQTKKD